MAKIVLISCVSKKEKHSCKAKDLYVSDLFKKSLYYAEEILKADKIFILSAKYGLISTEQVIEPYDKTLNKMMKKERIEWSNSVIKDLKNNIDIDNDEVIFLAGRMYREYIEPCIKNTIIPMKDLKLGQQLNFLNSVIMNHECECLHNYIRSLKRYSFPFNDEDIFENGIYILFEKNEYGHNGDRIVRIGTHTGNDNLVKRLMEHFLTENKNRSIFRKNIGRALLNKNNDNYLDIWNLDLTSKKAQIEHQSCVDKDYESNIEKQVSDYIRDNFTFAVIEELDKKKRLSLEKHLINVVSSCSECGSSNNWLGRYSPVNTIRDSGLWQIQHVKTTK